MKPIQTWFPTSIYYAPLLPRRAALARLNRELLKECYQIRDNDPEGRKWSVRNYPRGFTSYASLCHLNRMSSTFGELERHITRHVRRFTQHLDMDIADRKITMTDCWVNIMPPGAVHGLHLHPLSFISGSYYVRTPRGSSAIKFEDPRLSKFMAAPPKLADAAPANRQFVTYPVEAAHVVLFESWLRHEVPPSTITQDRISISFNYHWE